MKVQTAGDCVSFGDVGILASGSPTPAPPPLSYDSQASSTPDEIPIDPVLVGSTSKVSVLGPCLPPSTTAASSDLTTGGSTSVSGSNSDLSASPLGTVCLTSPSIVAENDAIWWDAVMTRSSLFVGIFWYGVKSTGVYCRPTCPSRRPGRRANVSFYYTCEEAEAAGFRECKRCRPKEEQDPAQKRQSTAIRQVIDFLSQAAVSGGKAPTLDHIAKEAGMSPFYLHRTFKKRLGVSPRGYYMSLLDHRTDRCVT